MWVWNHNIKTETVLVEEPPTYVENGPPPLFMSVLYGLTKLILQLNQCGPVAKGSDGRISAPNPVVKISFQISKY